MSSSWLNKLQNDEIVLIDGATGTELQRRGVPMDEIAWSGAAVLSHPNIVRETHEDYILVGAEVVIANTRSCEVSLNAHTMIHRLRRTIAKQLNSPSGLHRFPVGYPGRPRNSRNLSHVMLSSRSVYA